MNECIEVEYSDDYKRGYEEGIEAGRVIAVAMVEDEREKWKSRSCRNCCCFDDGYCIRATMKHVPNKILFSGCGFWEPMGSC